MKTVLKRLFVMVGAATLILTFTEAGYVADWSFYGSARMATMWNDFDRDAGDDDGIQWFLQKNSRIGARVRGDTISGFFEYGTGVDLRFLYATWNFGPGSLWVGQFITPTYFIVSNQVFGEDSLLLPFGGGFWPGRTPALQVYLGESFSTHAWFALVQPGPANPIIKDDGEGDNILPLLEASFAYKKDWFRIRATGGYQTYEVENSSIGDYDVDAYVIGFGGRATPGPLTIRASLTYGANWSNYGGGVFTTGNSSAFISGTSVDDTISFGMGGSLRYKANDRFSLEAGYAYVQHDPDVAGQQEDNTQSYYIQCNFSPVRGVNIIPEIGVVDLMENNSGEDQGKITYIGAQWKINF